MLDAAERQFDAAARAIVVEEHLARAQTPREAHLPRAVASPDARDEAVLRAVRERERYVIVAKGHRGEHGSELFVACETVARGHIAHQRGRLIEAAFRRFGNYLAMRCHCYA